jgi:hypothetical protein
MPDHIQVLADKTKALERKYWHLLNEIAEGRVKCNPSQPHTIPA